MNAWIQHVHFLRPLWFYALIPVIILLIVLWRRHREASTWKGLIAPELLQYLLLDRSGRAQRMPLLLLGMAWVLVITAMAGPTWQQQPQPVYLAQQDRVFLLDLSPSMAATDVSPDRVSRARFALTDMLDAAGEGRNALIVFSSEAHIVIPLTDDRATIKALLPALSVSIMPVSGDQAASAFGLAEKLLNRGGGQHGQLILLSDGVADTAETLNTIRRLHHHGIRVSVFGVGSMAGAPVPVAQGGFESTASGNIRLSRLDETGLTEMVHLGGGHYLRMGDGSPASLLMGVSAMQEMNQVQRGHQDMDRWVEQGAWLLLPVLLMAAAGFRRGWLVMLLLLPLASPAQASVWQDLWLRPDQQAARILQDGKAADAAKLFHDSRWKATAHYQAGDYKAAAKEFAADDADSLYNRGNAQAQAGQLEQAYQSYTQALSKNPQHEDARFNRHLIQKMLRKQARKNNGKASDTTKKNKGKKGKSGDKRGSKGQSKNGSQQAGQQKKEQNTHGTTQQTHAAQQRSESSESAQPDTHKMTHNEAQQARQDVAPAALPHKTDQSQQHKLPRTSRKQAPSSAEKHRPSERDMALEQWLRQVPDDPAGLLRRKFMLEHMLRKQGKREP